MYHYLFTNDLRITTLNVSLKKAGESFINNHVPSAAKDKSRNNNMKTLGFYFNLTKDSTCAKEAAKGNIKKVVLNFTKKFQFPNLRTKKSFDNCLNDGITLAPMRSIVCLLNQMNLLYGFVPSYLTRDEIKYFIFYNDAVAKTKNPDYINVARSVIKYRRTKIFPVSVSADESDHEWKQEERQIREMVKILKWLGYVTEEDNKIFISFRNLTKDELLEIKEIITYDNFWRGDCLEEYQEYMDI